MSKKVRLLSLFSGIGAPEKALKNLGYDIDLINYCEIDRFSSTSYSVIHGVSEELNLKDVKKVDGKLFKNVDLLFHGSPCQSFSAAGRQEGGDENSGTKSSLMWETVRIVSECKPKIVIWENVKSVLNKKHKHNFDLYLEKLNDLGYSSSHAIISPRDLGEAQSRERIFVISLLDKQSFIFPSTNKTHQKTLKDYLEENVDERYILPKKAALNFAYTNPNFIGRMCISKYSDLAGCLVAKSGKAARTNNYLLYNYSDYQYYSNGKDIQFFADNNIPIRSLTPLEYWRLQNFDDTDFYLAQEKLATTYKNGDVTKTDAQLYKQAGNSINVKVLESFLKKLIDENI